MSDLLGGGQPSGLCGNGRAQNGGSRTAQGPVPVPTQDPSRVRTPTDIMRQRRDREARRKAEQEARQREEEEEESRRIQEQERQERAAGVAGESPTQRRSRGGRVSGEAQYAQDPGRRQERTSTGAPTRNRLAGAQPTSTTSAGSHPPEQFTESRPVGNGLGTSQVPPASGRQRGASVSTGQPRPVQSQQQPRSASATYASQQPQSGASQSRAGPGTASQAPPSQAGPSTAAQYPAPQGVQNGGQPSDTQGQSQQSRNRPGFPHAFERWETLSSHWEGLTSYWMRKLQQNSDEMNREPLNQQMSRQITDLSAAGANLFHAVVELQRLRASSERKFQRWYFDTRAEHERFQEVQGELEGLLRVERQGRADAVAALGPAEAEKNKAKDLVKEMQRELQISKEEARRAWEELGRREQEERDRTTSLRNGEPTLVGGVQVVPMMQGVPSRQTSTNRPPTREGPYAGGPGPSTIGGQTRRDTAESPSEEGQYGYEPQTEPQTSSPTETDPFTESGREIPAHSLHHEPDVSSFDGPLRQPPSSSAAIAALRAAQTTATQAQLTPSTVASTPARSYAQAPPTQSPSSRFYQHEGSALHPQSRASEADQGSFIPSTEGTGSDLGEEEYAIDPDGNYRLDAQGRRIVLPRALSDDSDEYDVQDQLERERAYGSRYGGGVSGVEYGSGSTATAGQRPGYAQGAADYSGQGWGGPGATGWEAITPRHRHPTRLSDVLEEDERSRTSPSRASQASRSMH